MKSNLMDKQPNNAQRGLRPNFILPIEDELDFLKDADKKFIADIWENCKPKFHKCTPIVTMYYGTGTVESTDEFEEAYSGAKFPHSLGIHFIKEATEFIDKNKTDFTNDLIF